MQFQVPQFIETEPKIVGPLTLKQFGFIAVASIVSFLLFFIFEIWLWLLFTVILGSIAAGMAFLKYEGQPMPRIVVAAIRYKLSPKLYLWKSDTTAPGLAMPHIPENLIHKGRRTPLKELAEKIVTTTHAIEKREKPLHPFDFLHLPNKIQERFEALKKTTGEREMARRVDYR